MEREEFCILVEKLIRTCKSKGKYYVLTKFYPSLCFLLWEIRNITVTTRTLPMCHQMKWSPQDMGFDDTDPRIQNVEGLIYFYAKSNLAVVNIYIKEPVVTNIWRDQKTPVINFIAYTGGLLGLCMGFSLVSLFEILYYTFKTLPWKKWLRLVDVDAPDVAQKTKK